MPSMDAELTRESVLNQIGPGFSEADARAIVELGPEVSIFAILTLAKRVAELSGLVGKVDPSVPSGQMATFLKPKTKGRRKKPGAQPGHAGSRRETPKPDKTVTHSLERCPECSGSVSRCNSSRCRIIEDIQADSTPSVTGHVVPRYWCAQCRKKVEPVVEDALPDSQIGHRAICLAGMMHYLQGTTLGQILDVYNYHLHFPVTEGGLMHAWHRAGEILRPWYDSILEEIQGQAVLNADETGWRVQGKTFWLWCLASKDAVYYLIDPKRGSGVLKKLFRACFNGVLVTDFWGAYNSVLCLAKQKCLPHLLRDLSRTRHYHNPGGDWPEFHRRLRRLIRDGMRLKKDKQDLGREVYERRKGRIRKRLDELIDQGWKEKHARRLQKRLRRHREELLTFLDYEEVPPDNNAGERGIRPAVLIRKNSYANGSEKGAQTQATLMTILRTLKMRGHNPVQVLVDALKSYVRSGQLPPLPAKITAVG